MKRKQPKIQQTITIKRNVGFFIIKNEVALEYLPFITAYGIALYNVYAAMANRGMGNRWFVSLPTLERYTLMSRDTILQYNWLLEVCKMISIKSGTNGYANEYTVLEPEPITPEIIEQIHQELIRPIQGHGKNWRGLKSRAIDRLYKMQRMIDCGKPSQYKNMVETQKEAGQQDMFSPESKPETKLAEPQPADDLIQKLVARFAGNKPHLTENSAAKMIKTYGAEVVEQQLEWLDQREIDDNPLKTLRASLKYNWSAPDELDEPVNEPDRFEVIAESFGLNGSTPKFFDQPPPTPLQQQWDEVKQLLEMQMTQAAYEANIQLTELVAIEDNVWLIGCETERQQDWLQHRLHENIARVVAQVAGEDVELRFVVLEKISQNN